MQNFHLFLFPSMTKEEEGICVRQDGSLAAWDLRQRTRLWQV